jgi:hypothetical protein
MLQLVLDEKLRAFDRVMAGIVASEGRIASLRKRFEAEFPWAKNTHVIEDMIRDVFPDGEWEWGWHTIWSARFERIGVRPCMWLQNYQTKYGPDRQSLLAHYVTHVGYAEGKLARRLPSDDMCCIDMPMHDEAPQIIELLHELALGYAKGNVGSSLPPFFPGDRTGFRVFSSAYEWAVEDYGRLGMICRLQAFNQ